MSDHSKDFFIKDELITAYSINAFAQAIAQTVAQQIPLDYDSARRIGSSFSINFYKKSAKQIVEEKSVETEEAPATQEEDQQESADSTDVQESTEEQATAVVGVDEGNGSGYTEEVPLPTLEQIEAAKNSMRDLMEIAEPFDITGRSKKDLTQKLKELIGAE